MYAYLKVEVYDPCRMWRCSGDGRIGLIGGFGQWGPFRDVDVHAILAKRDEYKVICFQRRYCVFSFPFFSGKTNAYSSFFSRFT